MAENPTGTAEGNKPTAKAAGKEAPAAAPQVDYNAILDSIPDNVLRSHRRINGYAGEIAQRERHNIEAESRTKADREAEERLIREAEENPFEFTQKWLKGKAAERAQLEIDQVKKGAQAALFERVANSYAALPEWRNLTPDEFARVQRAVAGKSDEELVAAFNVAALDVLADRRANTRAEQHYSDRLEAEVQARLTEAQAARLRGERAPDMSAPVSAVGNFDPRNLSPEEFDRWYKQTFGV
jgi:hypothetical protein